MVIHGYQVVSEPSGKPETWVDADGVEVPENKPEKRVKLVHDGHLTVVKDKDGNVIAGPFPLVREAIQAIQDKHQAELDEAKAKLQAVADAAPVT